jgi:hypothetical protein
MKIICTTVIRASQQGDVHGGLYVIDMDSEEVIHHAPYAEDFVNDNERGGERGLRGIAVLDDRIIVADSSGLMELDKDNFKVTNRIQDDNLFKSIHEICVHDNLLYITSTAYDKIVVMDLDFKLVKVLEVAGEDGPDYKILTGLIESEPTPPEIEDKYHINSISSTGGRVVFSGLITHLYSFEDMQVVAPMPITNDTKSFEHNFYEYEDLCLVNLTTFGYLGLLGKNENRPFWKFIKLPKSKKVKFSSDAIASNNWNRGIARKGDQVVIGSSPARIILYNIRTNKIEKEVQLEEDVKHCIHGLEIIE